MNESKLTVEEAGFIIRAVAVVETNVLGVKGWFAHCLKCNTKSKPYSRMKPATTWAEQHTCQ